MLAKNVRHDKQQHETLHRREQRRGDPSGGDAHLGLDAHVQRDGSLDDLINERFDQAFEKSGFPEQRWSLARHRSLALDECRAGF